VVFGFSTICITGFFYLLPKFKILKGLLLSISLLGILFTITALILNPKYAAQNFTEINYLNNSVNSLILSNQQIFIVIGCLLIFIPLTIYFFPLKNSKIWPALITIVFGILVYSILFYHSYLKIKYPSNIITQPKQYGKVLELILGQDILLSDFDPQSTLKVERKKIYKAKFPVVDINLHLSSAFQTEADREVLSPENLIQSMDSVGVAMVFNSDVQGGDLEEVLNRYSRKYPKRIKNLWPTGFPPGINSNERLADLPKHLEDAIKMGAIGEGELWKNLGLTARDETGKVLAVDDTRIDPLWAKAGEIGVPVLWHMGDPAPMFQPVNSFNERYIELRRYPEWSYYGPGIPSRETIMKGRENVLRKHPNTIFIGCHMGWNSDDLSYAGYLLDTYPNYYLDLSTTLSELGRQPITTRKFFIKYQDRILFGTDGGSLFNVKGWTVEKFYRAYFEFLETDNEYIDYPMQGAINQGSWKIYGINLPDSVLQKIYYKNAEKLYNIKIVD
jgi:predicted TIM-barrel fold metal-dependent hydrolase